MFSGRGGISSSSRRNSASGSEMTGLNRRSKPMVELGRPHIAFPQWPSKCAGKTSI